MSKATYNKSPQPDGFAAAGLGRYVYKEHTKGDGGIII